MAVQNYLAVKSQREILESEIKREEFEMQTIPEKEKQEIEEIYRAKGFEGAIKRNSKQNHVKQGCLAQDNVDRRAWA